MKKSKLTKVIAIVLAITMLSATFGAVTAGASSIYPVISNEGDVIGVLFADIVDTLLRILTDFLSSLFGDGPTFYPEDDAKLQEKINANYYPGTGNVLQKTAEVDAKWHLGYSNASLIPEDYDNGTYYIGGYIAPENGFTNVVEGIAEIPGIGKDDMKVRCMAISDGTGRGTVLFAVVDCIGITNADIKDIRERLATYARANNIVAINVSSTHTHSCIDTEGLWTRNIAKLVSNGVISGTKAEGELQQGTNPAYMEWMKDKVADALVRAHKDMEPGTLTYTTKDIGQDYFQNKNRPSSGQIISVDDEGNLITNAKDKKFKTKIAMTNIERFIFTPDEKTIKPTMILNIAAHPDVAGLPTDSNSGREISGDYIFYCGKYLEKAGYNFIFFQGSIAGIYMARTVTGDNVETKQRVEESQRYGYELARIALSLNLTEEEAKNNPLTSDNAKEIADNTKQVPLFDANRKPAEQATGVGNNYTIVLDAQGKDVKVDNDKKTIKIYDGDKLIYDLAYSSDTNIQFDETTSTQVVSGDGGILAVILVGNTNKRIVCPSKRAVAVYGEDTILIQQLPVGRVVSDNVEGAATSCNINPHYSVWYEDWNKNAKGEDAVPDAVPVDPFLNLYIKQVEIPVSNALIQAVGKLNMANYVVISKGNNTYSTITEIGYLELGKQFKAVFLPGEICQDLVAPNGASLVASNAVTARPFSYYTNGTEITASSLFGKDVKCFGLMNDAIGYVVPDNDYTMGDPANHYHELISLGQGVSSALMLGLAELKAELK